MEPRRTVTPPHCALLPQVFYPATSGGALADNSDAATRQAIALLRWSHKFGPESNVQRAERFLNERVQLFTPVRHPHAGHFCMLIPLHQLQCC